MTGLIASSLALLNPSLLDFSIQQWRATPEMRIDDAYKWLFHATLGGEHAITNEAGPRAWMDREWSAIGVPLSGEPEVQPLRPDGTIVRVNLRPVKAAGGDKERVLRAFVDSARSFRADKSSFMAEWQRLRARLAQGPIGKMSLGDWRRFDAETRPFGYPAVHHSEVYEAAYKPAYRVILKSMWR